jgi:hypothetical protein
MKTNYKIGMAGIATALLAALTGCTTYVVQPADPQPAYVPPSAPVIVQQPAPAPVIVETPPAVVVIQQDDDFVQPLSPYGEWVDVNGYGRCWRPAHVESGWRPYSNGHWESTADGWYWVSDEPWAWATYHYGRWQLAGNYGWVWVPQTQWAPAWVSWREGGGYVGWAPLPPEPRGGVSVNVTIAPAAFCFVEERRMHEPVRPTTVIVNNTTIINKTVNITKTKVVNKVVINEGPRRDEVEKATGKKIQEVSIKDLRQKDEEPVAEKHQNLRARDNRAQQPQQTPQPKQTVPERPLQKLQQQRPAEKPARVEPAPVVPAREVPPADNKNQERLQQQQQKQLQQQQEKLKQQQEKEQEQQEKQRQQEEKQQQQQQQKLQQQQEKQQQQLQKQQQQQDRQQKVQPAPTPQQRPFLTGKQPSQNPPRNNRGRQPAGTNTTENPSQGGPRR